MVPELSHFDEQGNSRMVDVGNKVPTARKASASCEVRMQPQTLRLVLDRSIAKGNVLEVARIAGIMAAKRTPELIPLCHSIFLSSVQIEFRVQDEKTIQIIGSVSAFDKTGVEMEALTAVTVAALTIYDMCKGVDRSMNFTNVLLLEKTGGKDGDYKRS